MNDGNSGPTGGARAFDPAKVDDFLGTGGGLLGELAGRSAGDWESEAAERWLGARLGPYRIAEYLDRGGMALVFRAERCDGRFEQQVAIKLLRSPDAAELAQRFAREQQFLARLEHPGIARIIDSGVVDGQPWIAMELVDGVPIDRYCDRHQIDLIGRLRLFVRAAQAVQFAHSRLVIHRDLKPSNIFVGADGRPKLLDFGIGKALQGDDAELTGPAILLTPLYASPEQVLGAPVGVASDVYQLGLLLYRLLTGCDAQAMESASVVDIKAVVVDDEPLSPSTQIQTTGRRDAERIEQIAVSRSTSPSKLGRKLSGDLDAIVMQALRKDPERRYQTVAELITDVESYCASRPVTARPTTRWYRARRFAQRHRGGVLAGVLITLVLLISAVSVALSWRSTIQAQRLALEEVEGARQVGDFLSGMLAQANPTVSGGAELTVRRLLDASATRLDALGDRPRVRARLLEVIAAAYESMAMPDRAEPLARSALAIRQELDDSAGQVEPLSLLAMIRMQQGALEDARSFGERAVATAGASGVDPLSRARAHDALSTVLAQSGAYAEEREQLQAALAQLEGLNGDPARRLRAEVLMKLGSNSKQAGEYNRSREEFEAALEFLGSAPDERATRMFTLRELGTLHSNLGDELLAVDLLGQSLDLAREVYGNESANILGSLVLLGRSLGNLNRIAEAEALFDEALAIAAATIGKDHGNYARILHDYAEIVRRGGDFARVRAMRDEAVRIAEAFFGPDHSTAVNLRKARAFVELDEGRYLEAVSALGRVESEVERAFGENHMITFGTRAARAEALLHAGDLDAAREAMLRLRDSGRSIADGHFYGYQRNLVQLVRLHVLTGPLEAAVAYGDEAVALRRDMDGGGGWTLLEPLVARSQALVLAGDAGADADIHRALELIAANPKRITLPMHGYLCGFAATLARAGRADEARRLCRHSLSALEAALASDHPILGYARGDCAEVHLRDQVAQEAVRLLELALPVITEVLDPEHWRSRWAVAMLATARGQPERRAAAVAELRDVLGATSPLVDHLVGMPAPD